jgi:hypothetical protein
MANHYQHPVVTRRDRALEQLLELLTRIVELWVEFWAATEPGQHANGATDRWSETLHNIPTPNPHEQLTVDTGRYTKLLAAQVISGDPELTECKETATNLNSGQPNSSRLESGPLTAVDGWTLAGNLYDPTGGAA